MDMVVVEEEQVLGLTLTRVKLIMEDQVVAVAVVLASLLVMVDLQIVVDTVVVVLQGLLELRVRMVHLMQVVIKEMDLV